MRFLPILLVAGVPGLFAYTSKVSPDLNGYTPGQQLGVIIQLRNVPPAALSARIRKHGGVVRHSLDAIGSYSATVPASALQDLGNHPDIEYISPDRPLRASALDYGTETTKAPIAWLFGYDGNGVGVAVIDSGVGRHHDLGTDNSRVVYSESFLTDKSTDDKYGHGTHVAGLIAGDGDDSSGYPSFHTFRGIAPKANIINLRVLDENGAGTDSAVIAALARAVQLKARYNIRVINLSLGRPVFESYKTDPLCRAVESAWKAGILVVVAAGNDGRNDLSGNKGYFTMNSPGNDPYVLTVGSMKTLGTMYREDDRIASYSSKGPTVYDYVAKPDIVAPGNRAISLYDQAGTLEQQSPENTVPSSDYQLKGAPTSHDYFTLSGSSMAAAVVSGAAALVFDKNHSANPDLVKALLMKTASKTFIGSVSPVDPGVPYQAQYDIFTIGAGYLDVAAALLSPDCMASTGNLSAKSPSLV